jgi:hypothetical protein
MSHASDHSLSSAAQLQAELRRVRQDCDRALEDAAKWRRRYEVEAKQRRAEAEAADQTIRNLRAELLQLCQLGPSVRLTSPRAETPPDLAKLREECVQLTEALAQERQQHAKTRENLITVLGEALHRGKA